MRRALILAVLLIVAQVSLAQTHDAASPVAQVAEASHAAITEPHPVLAEDPYWTPIMLILIAMMFLSAAVIGPIVRLNMPEEVPPAHSHDEPPGTSHHHGASGTLNPAPEAELHDSH